MDTKHTSRGASSLTKEVKQFYSEGFADYDIPPIILADTDGAPAAVVRDGDAVIFCCRRGEREIQLTRSFADPAFDAFPVQKFRNLHFVALTLYHEMLLKMPVSVAFPPPLKIKDTLGEVVSASGLRQLRVAESEKYNHVTFFFNGCNNDTFTGQEGITIPSMKGVSFDKKPELKSPEVADAVVKGLTSKVYDLIVVNFANGDIIGHFDNKNAKIACAQAVDTQLGRVIDAAGASGYVTVITADHGMLEMMIKPDGKPNTSHTRNPVPFIIADPELRSESPIILRQGGSLADVAPTILDLMHLPKPELMTGQSLLKDNPLSGKGRKVLLIVLDGWGIGTEESTNPIVLAETPIWDDLVCHYPFASLKASGQAVGLMDIKPGNSEAGHSNIGAGRVVLQDDARINHAIETGAFSQNPVFLQTMSTIKKRDTALHLLAFLSETSSHGNLDYPFALLRLAKAKGLKKVFVHAIFDGRSTSIRSAPRFLGELEKEMDNIGIGTIVSGIGRGMALDRDGNYEKTRKAYDAYVRGVGKLTVNV